jgi:hypothetical protein
VGKDRRAAGKPFTSGNLVLFAEAVHFTRRVASHSPTDQPSRSDLRHERATGLGERLGLAPWMKALQLLRA